MWQHRWAVWGGILGATASCLAKIAVSSDPINPLVYVQDRWCEPFLTSTDWDNRVQEWMHPILQFWLRLEEATPTFISEKVAGMSTCQLIILVPRIACFIAMLLVNAYMIAAFIRGMQHSGSVVGTSITTASNFSTSAFLGALIWKERFSPSWWVGFALVLFGVLLLSSRQVVDEEVHDTAPSSSPQQSPRVSPQDRTTVETKANPPSPESKSCPTTSPDVISTTQEYSSSKLPDRSLSYDCPLCKDPLFDKMTGVAKLAVADASPTCYHIMHAQCLKQHRHNPQQQPISQSPSSPPENSDMSPSKTQKGLARNPVTCPLCHKAIAMFVSSKQAAHFAVFWMKRVEQCLQRLGPKLVQDPATEQFTRQPLPAKFVREHLQRDDSLTEQQKRYIDDDPTGLGKGLLAALEWGGSEDYNNVKTGQRGWNLCLQTKGIWNYSPKHDDLWLWEWGAIHPRQRCDQCQLLNKPLTVACPDCQDSAEAAYYCSQACQKRDWQRHKMSCQMWQQQGPSSRAMK